MKFSHVSGDRVLPGYTIKRGIGQGGFGEVYYGVSDAGKEVALKLIQRGLEVELRGVLQCLNLKNPHLIELYDVRQNDAGENWVIMEYVSGPSLDRVLQQSPNGLDPAEARAWFEGLCQGVAYLHDRGIVHRDLKPGNIFREDTVVKLGDYGLSKFISASRHEGQTDSIGTVHYMAPEVSNGKYGKEIDIYALGIIYYELLTGHRPFDGESVGEILMKHLTAAPDLTRVQEPVKSMIARCLQKDPHLRFSSVQQMLSALKNKNAGDDVMFISEEPAAPPKRSQPQPDIQWVEQGNANAPPVRSNVPPARNVPRPAAQPPIQILSVNAGPAPAVMGRPLVAPRQQMPYAPPPPHHRPTSAQGSSGPLTWKTMFSDEPIARQLADFFARSSQQPAMLGVLLIAAVVSLIVAPWAWMLLFWVYGMYFVVRLVVLCVSPPAPIELPPAPLAGVAAAGTAPMSAPAAPVAAPRVLKAKSAKEWCAELFSGLLLGGLTSLALSFLVMALLQQTSGHQTRPEEFAWLALIGTLGSTMLLMVTKFWEGQEGDGFQRRFSLLLGGFAVGAAAYAADLWMLVHYASPQDPLETTWRDLRFPEFGVATHAGAHPAVPNLIGYMVFFGLMFFVLRWWKQSDPLRMVRVSPFPVLICAGWGYLLDMLWPNLFPPMFGLIWGIVISLSVQLASAWQPLEKKPS